MPILGSVLGCPDCDRLSVEGKACGAHDNLDGGKA